MRYRPITAADVEADPHLAEWRVRGTWLCATFRLPSFAGAARLVAAIGALADDCDHHPDVDLRYPGDVHVRMTTHHTGGLTDADASLATAIGGAAAAAGATVVAEVIDGD